MEAAALFGQPVCRAYYRDLAGGGITRRFIQVGVVLAGHPNGFRDLRLIDNSPAEHFQATVGGVVRILNQLVDDLGVDHDGGHPVHGVTVTALTFTPYPSEDGHHLHGTCEVDFTWQGNEVHIETAFAILM